eukprot:2369850-Rhodomonas_salina.4
MIVAIVRGTVIATVSGIMPAKRWRLALFLFATAPAGWSLGRGSTCALVLDASGVARDCKVTYVPELSRTSAVYLWCNDGCMWSEAG